MKQQLPNMEFGRRLAAERDLEKSDQFNRCNISRFSLTIDRDYVDKLQTSGSTCTCRCTR